MYDTNKQRHGHEIKYSKISGFVEVQCVALMQHSHCLLSIRILAHSWIRLKENVLLDSELRFLIMVVHNSLPRVSIHSIIPLKPCQHIKQFIMH